MFEIAIRRNDSKLAREYLDELTTTKGFAKSLRGKSYLSGAEIRLQQLDTQFQCDDAMLDQLFAHYHATKGLMAADC